MQLNDYQTRALESAIYPNRNTGNLLALVYCSLGLTEEAGETAGKLKKLLRDEEGRLTAESKERAVRELGDVLWYTAALARELGFTLEEVAETNLEKIADRKSRGTLRGSGDDR